jgi:hypothetical protein
MITIFRTHREVMPRGSVSQNEQRQDLEVACANFAHEGCNRTREAPVKSCRACRYIFKDKVWPVPG